MRFLVEYRIKSHIYSGFYIDIFDSRKVIRARNHLQSLEIHRRFQSVSTISGEFPQKASHITKKSACNMLQLLVSYVSLSVYIYTHHMYIYIYIHHIYIYTIHTYHIYIYTLSYVFILYIYIVYIYIYTRNRRQKGKTLQFAQLRAYRPRRHPIREGAQFMS